MLGTRKNVKNPSAFCRLDKNPYRHFARKASKSADQKKAPDTCPGTFRFSLSARLSGRGFLRHNANVVIDNLKKSAFDIEVPAGASSTKAKRACAEKRHQRSVILENTDLAVERGRDNG